MSQQQSLQQVLNLKEALEKEIDKNDDTTSLKDENERIQDILDRLNDVSMNLEILQETLIGASVNQLKKQYAPTSKIITTAKGLIKKWKKSVAVKNDTVGKSTADDSDKNITKKLDETSETKKLNSKRLSSAGSSSQNLDDNSNRSNKSNKSNNGNDDDDNNDEVEMIIPENEWISLSPHRQSICEKIYQTLLLAKSHLVAAGLHENAVINLIAPRTAEIEDAIYKKCKNDRKQYSDKARSIFFNMKQNKQLCLDVCFGHLEPEELVSYTTEQLADSSVLEAKKKLAQRLIDSKRLDWDQANEDKINKQCGITGDLLKASLFTCGRCKSIKTTSTQKQTRSADEPMTVFVLCLNCGKRWKC